MRVVAFGTEPVGVIAVGANATGVLAIGPLATGVIAIGQLARGVVSIGQLSLGVVAVGQLSIGVLWSMGQLGVAAFAGPGIIVGLFGDLSLRRLFRRDLGPAVTGVRRLAGAAGAARIVSAMIVVGLWCAVTGVWLWAGLGDLDGGDLPPPVPPPPTTTSILR